MNSINKNSLENMLLSIYATYKNDSVNTPEREQDFRIAMNAISRVISELKMDVDGEKRYQIDVLGNVAGYRNMDRIATHVTFVNNL